MNERIRELEVQCWEQTQYGPAWFNSTKFAELIVNDCLSIIERRKNWIDKESESYNYQWIYGYEKAIGHCSMFIKEFYGVEK